MQAIRPTNHPFDKNVYKYSIKLWVFQFKKLILYYIEIRNFDLEDKMN